MDIGILIVSCINFILLLIILIKVIYQSNKKEDEVIYNNIMKIVEENQYIINENFKKYTSLIKDEISVTNKNISKSKDEIEVYINKSNNEQSLKTLEKIDDVIKVIKEPIE